MKRLFIVLGMVISNLSLSGCQSTSTVDREFLRPLHEAKPGSILIVPVNNYSIDVLAPTSVLATLPFYLAERGYYVFPVHTVKTILEGEGYYEAAEVHQAPPQRLAELFGADTILYVTVNEWTAKYLILSTQTQVEFSYRLVAANGTPLWEQELALAYSPQQQNSTGNPLADLIASAITAAVERASPNYLPLTREANSRVFFNRTRGIPPGPYSPAYQQYYSKLEAPTTQE